MLVLFCFVQISIHLNKKDKNKRSANMIIMSVNMKFYETKCEKIKVNYRVQFFHISSSFFVRSIYLAISYCMVYT